MYQIELLGESDIVKAENLDELMKEADELIAILVISAKTAKQRRRSKRVIILHYAFIIHRLPFQK